MQQGQIIDGYLLRRRIGSGGFGEVWLCEPVLTPGLWKAFKWVPSSHQDTRHISSYASTQPMEDFAENFMHFVKHRGILPAKWQTRHIEKRWKFVRNLPMLCN